jgi:anti-sigma regulatory factor (Ser/Thr protein kinase)
MRTILSSSAAAPAAARRAIEPITRSLSARAASELLVVVTELVSNAVRHSRDGAIGLEVELEEGLARVEVTDPGEGFEAPEKPRSAYPERGGFGLVLVDRLARRWGVRRDRDSTVVWSELPR